MRNFLSAAHVTGFAIGSVRIGPCTLAFIRPRALVLRVCYVPVMRSGGGIQSSSRRNGCFCQVSGRRSGTSARLLEGEQLSRSTDGHQDRAEGGVT